MTQRTNEQELASILRATLRREGYIPPGASDAPLFLELVDRHGIGPFLYDLLQTSAEAPRWPLEILVALGDQARSWALKSSLRRTELHHVLGSLTAVGIIALLMKGVPLGYTVYPSPALRPCGDVDIFVREGDIPLVASVLRELGYECLPFEVSALNPETNQRTFERREPNGYWHRIDLHWRISSFGLYANLFEFDEVLQRSVCVPSLSEHAKTLDPIDALVLACAHRSANEDYYRLIWLSDVNQLARRLDEGGVVGFSRLARSKRVRAVCLDSVLEARRWFATPLPDGCAQGLARAGTELPEFSRLTLRPKRRPIDRLMHELLGIRGVRAKCRYLGALMFPPETKMRVLERVSRRRDLPWAYLLRLIRKAPAYFRTRA